MSYYVPYYSVFLKVNNLLYNHPLGMNLYNLNNSKEYIILLTVYGNCSFIAFLCTLGFINEKIVLLIF